MRQVTEVVIEAHRAGIVHRDIHPNNIALEFGEFDEITVTVLDFGIAHLVGPGKADRDYILGRKNWMSPEQAAGGTIDRRSDIFNLGILLYTLLTGRQPYPDGFKRLGRLPRRLPPPSVVTKGDAEAVRLFDEVTLRALRLDRSERYQTAEEFLDALDGALQTRPGPRKGLILLTVFLILAAAVFAALAAT
jgi:serine/threonine-protein kinase